MKERVQRLLHWHVVHKGESTCHFCYLAFTFVEAHGIHAMFAGGVAVFLVIGAFVRSADE